MSTIQELVAKVAAQPKINGSPLAAYFAQINRFIVHSGQPPVPVDAPQLTPATAYTGILLLQARLISGLVTLPDPAVQTLLAELDAGLKDPMAYVGARLTPITQTLALYGDMLHLPVASVGITVNSIKRGWGTLGFLAALLVFGVGGTVVYRYHQRQLPAAE